MNEKITYYTIDFNGVKNLRELHYKIKDALNFPYYYGCNLDALWDCITDLYLSENIHLFFKGFDRIEALDKEYAEKILKILHRLKHIYEDEYYNNGRIFIERNGETEEIL